MLHEREVTGRKARPSAENRDRSPGPRSKKKKRGGIWLDRRMALALAVALVVASFGAGWFFGVQSIRYHGKILLVNESHRLPADYVPEGLVNLYTQRHSFRMASSEIYLTRQTYEAMEKMFHAAEQANMNGYIVTSGYRSYQRQQEVYAQSEPGKAQQPGASEHQTGLAFDVTVETNDGFESTPQYGWLMEHAHEYGFIQRYPANKSDITGISYEPWHYRYVGVEAAKKMRHTGQTLEEFLGKR